MGRRPVQNLPRAGRTALVAVAALVALIAGTAAPAFADYAQIEGDGSTWSQVIFNQWIADVTPSGIQVVYNGVGSSVGRSNFAGAMDDFAISEIPYQGTDEKGQQDESKSRAYAYLPIVAGGTAFTYHVEVGGVLMRDVRLSGETIAKIFTNVITNWSDPAIRADNNGRTFPDLAIQPVVRSDGSGTTAQFTTWLDKQYSALWTAYRGKAGLTSYYPTTDTKNSKTKMISAPGSDQVMNTISAGSGNGTIGYVEYSYALNKDYPVVKVLNTAGYYVEPTDFNVAVALTKAQINTDPASPLYLTQLLDGVYTNPDPRAYPLSSYSYMIIPTGASDARMTTAKRQSLADLMFHGLCEGQNEAGPYGYSPLPLNLVQAGFDQLAKLKAADPAVDIQGRDVTKCNNPTFVAGNLNANHLADTAPQPAACDKTGTGPCLPAGAPGAGSAGGVPVWLGVPGAPAAPAGLVLVVPTAAGIALTGQWDAANTRITATADLPTISVVDARSDELLTGWQVNAQSQSFAGAAGIVDAKYLGWAPALPQVTAEAGGPLAVRAGAVVSSFFDSATSTGLGTSRLLGETTSSGRGTTTLGGRLDLVIPTSTAPGSYTSTITLTLVAG